MRRGEPLLVGRRPARPVLDASAGSSTPSTGSRSTSRPARRSGSSASRAAARASPRSRCSGSSPRAGRVTHRHGAASSGRDLLTLNDRGAARRSAGAQIAMIFQDPMTSLNPVLTIGRQISEPLETHFGMRREADRAARGELLERVGIPSPKARLTDYPHQFSGGMRQRAMIAMALACKPKLLIADEPTTALDVTIQAQILDAAARARRRGGHRADPDHARPRRRRRHVRARQRDVRRHVHGDRHRPSSSSRRPRHPYTLGLLQSVPAARRDPARQAAADRRRATRHAAAAERLPLPAALPLRGRPLAQGGAAARRDRARAQARVLQPGPGEEWQDRAAATA